MDPHIDKHEKIEELMAEDLENWLCNLYFEIVKLPRWDVKKLLHVENTRVYWHEINRDAFKI